jgi:ribosomal protein L37E
MAKKTTKKTTKTKTTAKRAVKKKTVNSSSRSQSQKTEFDLAEEAVLAEAIRKAPPYEDKKAQRKKEHQEDKLSKLKKTLIVHYEKNSDETYSLYAMPLIESIIPLAEQLDCEFEWSKEEECFVGQVGIVPKHVDTKYGIINFVEYKNVVPTAATIKSIEKKVSDYEQIKIQIKALVERQQELKAQLVDSILENGVRKRKGREFHTKLLVGEWLAEVQQKLSVYNDETTMYPFDVEHLKEIEKENPAHQKELKSLFKKVIDDQYIQMSFPVNPKRKNQVSALSNLLSNHKGLDVEVLLNVDFEDEKEIKDELKAFKDVESENCSKINEQKFDGIMEKIPYKIRMEHFKALRKSDDIKISFHSRTNQKTKGDCELCGGKFEANTSICSECGLSSLETKRKTRKTPAKKTSKKRTFINISV